MSEQAKIRRTLEDFLVFAEEVDQEIVCRGRDAYLASRILPTGLRVARPEVGEAANRVPAEFRDAHPQVAWRPIRGMRNVVTRRQGVRIGVRARREMALTGPHPSCPTSTPRSRQRDPGVFVVPSGHLDRADGAEPIPVQGGCSPELSQSQRAHASRRRPMRRRRLVTGAGEGVPDGGASPDCSGVGW